MEPFLRWGALVLAVASAFGLAVALTLQAVPRYELVISRSPRWGLIVVLTAIVVASIAVYARSRRQMTPAPQKPRPLQLVVAGLCAILVVNSGVLFGLRVAGGFALEVWGGIPWAAWTVSLLALFLLCFVILAVRGKRRQRVGPEIVVAAAVLGVVGFVSAAAPTFQGHIDWTYNSATQSTLRNGLAAAKAYFVDDDTFDGFTPVAAAGIEPALGWTDQATIEPHVAQIVVAEGDRILMVSTSEYGKPFCIAEIDGATYFGTTAATSPETCTGDW